MKSFLSLKTSGSREMKFQFTRGYRQDSWRNSRSAKIHSRLMKMMTKWWRKIYCQSWCRELMTETIDWLGESSVITLSEGGNRRTSWHLQRPLEKGKMPRTRKKKKNTGLVLLMKTCLAIPSDGWSTRYSRQQSLSKNTRQIGNKIWWQKVQQPTPKMMKLILWCKWSGLTTSPEGRSDDKGGRCWPESEVQLLKDALVMTQKWMFLFSTSDSFLT